jgi:hypothetical protein
MESAKRSTPVAIRPVGFISVNITIYTKNDAKRKTYLPVRITGQSHGRFGRKFKTKKGE